MDVARVLVEVNLMKPLLPKICFMDKDQRHVTVLVKYMWLPPCCTTCNGWGHVETECKAQKAHILLPREQSGTNLVETPGKAKEMVLEFLDELGQAQTGTKEQGAEEN
ncbi:Uncharacterized protein Rs2_02888 [Raphanus sativus]|nr:Uncharacterized protein Rs2_02888 [Raphanus sativus]